MRGNIVTAAVALGLALVIAAGVLVLGLRWVALGAVDRWVAGFHVAAHDHAAGIDASVRGHASALDAAVQRHGGAIEAAGMHIATPHVRFVDPVSIREPVTVQGPRRDGSLPVNATLGD